MICNGVTISVPGYNIMGKHAVDRRPCTLPFTSSSTINCTYVLLAAYSSDQVFHLRAEALHRHVLLNSNLTGI